MAKTKIKFKEMHYAKDCASAGEHVKDNMYECKHISALCYSRGDCPYFKNK